MIDQSRDIQEVLRRTDAQYRMIFNLIDLLIMREP